MFDNHCSLFTLYCGGWARRVYEGMRGLCGRWVVGVHPVGDVRRLEKSGARPLFIYSKFFAKDWSYSDRAVIVEVVQIVLCALVIVCQLYTYRTVLDYFRVAIV